MFATLVTLEIWEKNMTYKIDTNGANWRDNVQRCRLTCHQLDCGAVLSVTVTGEIRVNCTECECSDNKRVATDIDGQALGMYCTNCDDCGN